MIDLRKTELCLDEAKFVASKEGLQFRLTCTYGLIAMGSYIARSNLVGKRDKGVITPDFKHQGVYDICFSEVGFSNLYFEDVSFNNIDFSLCEFVGCLFKDCRFKNCTFKNCRFSNVTFTGTSNVGNASSDITNCEFIDTLFLMATFSHLAFTTNTFLRCTFERSVKFASVYERTSCYGSWNISNANYIYNCDCDGITKESLPEIKSWFPNTIPSIGGFYGWKVAVLKYKKVEEKPFYRKVILKLYIPAEAKRVIGPSYTKCRCSQAKLVDIQEVNDEKNSIALKEDESVRSLYDRHFVYPEIGNYVYPEGYNDDIRQTCASGIHFFLSRDTAVKYAAIS